VPVHGPDGGQFLANSRALGMHEPQRGRRSSQPQVLVATVSKVGRNSTAKHPMDRRKRLRGRSRGPQSGARTQLIRNLPLRLFGCSRLSRQRPLLAANDRRGFELPGVGRAVAGSSPSSPPAAKHALQAFRGGRSFDGSAATCTARRDRRGNRDLSSGGVGGESSPMAGPIVAPAPGSLARPETAKEGIRTNE
jgi:hypothetical protein